MPERSDVVEADARLTRMLEELRFVQDDALRGAAMCTARLRELQEQYAGLSLISVDPTIDGSHDAADDAALLERALIRGAGRSGLACPPLADGTPEKVRYLSACLCALQYKQAISAARLSSCAALTF